MHEVINRLILVAAVLMGSVAAVRSANDLAAPAPDWVIDAPAAQPNESRLPQVSGGTYFLVLDRQVMWVPERQVTFRRVAYKITERLGLEEGARILWSYDPTHESIRFHRIDIVRDGARLPQLDKTAIRTYQREEELDQGIVDGHLTAHADIADVRVGDVIEYELSVTSKPQLALGDFNDGFYARWEVPLAYQRYRLLLPGGQDLQVREYGIELQPDKTVTNGMTAYEWIMRDIEPVPSEAEQPVWHIQGGVLLSTTSRWAEVSKLLAPHYLLQRPLPADFQSKVDDIARRFPGRLDRVTEVLRLVQDSIRYVGNEIGRGAYIPRAPEATLRNGYGDCKDKTVLLISALQHLGMDASAALVHLSKGHGLKDRPPALSAFNHVIAVVRDGTATYWLDPTLSHQGGRLPDLAPPDYGYALPITETGADLVVIPDAIPDAADIDVKEVLAFPTEGQRIAFDVETVYTGVQADNLRWKISSTSESQIERNYFDYYAKRYPGLEAGGGISVTDDRDSNRISVTESYFLSTEALKKNDFGQRFPLTAYNLELLPNVTAQGRTQPVSISFPVNRRHVITVTGLQTPYIGPDRRDVENDFLKFSLQSPPTQGGLEISWQLQTKQRQVEAGQVGELTESVRQVSDALYWTYDFVSEPGAEEDLTDEDYLLIAIAILVLVVPIVLVVIFGLRYGLRADASYRAEAQFFPVSMSKFVIMSISSFMLYNLFWMYKFWRWKREMEGAKIMPAWRTFFCIIWLFPTFREANNRLGDAKIPVWIGVVGAIWLVVSTIANSVPADANPTDFYISLVVGLLGWLAFVPPVIAVNRLNGGDSAALKANSRYNGWNIAGMVIGFLFLFLMFVMGFLELTGRF
jgi:hypothetical protein